MARKTKEEARETRVAIVDAAVQVFSVKGVAATSLADVAREAGVTRGAIYWHFANKADLLAALWEEVLRMYASQAQASEHADEPDPLGKLKMLYVALLQGLIDNPRQQQLTRILFDRSGSAEDFEAIRIRHVACMSDRFERIQMVLRHAMERGQLPADMDCRLGAMAVLSYIHGLISQWVMTPDLIDMRQAAPCLIEGLMQMLRSGLTRG